ncbi:hypothetical protein RIF29_28896 [Crotalaria pallida]|uniref:Endonuclease/exonuclease/phosphatase domain-containing protein n=1 Tax=Crotalaria pallida TaxID=3830 RepID=A0AAN9EFP7_CROPI
MLALRRRFGFSNGVAVDCNAQRGGGLALLWKDSVEVSLQSYSTGHIDVKVLNQAVGDWRFTGFYGNPVQSLRNQSWDLIRFLSDQYELPWILGGDFNEILWYGEKEGGARKDQGLINRFREALDDCGLKDVGVRGNPFTRSRRNRNGQPIRKRLDRFVVNQSWKNMTQNYLVSHLSAPVSDHVPILMYFEFIQQRRRLKGRADRFFFETLWAGYENCESIISATWYSDNSANSLNAVAGKLHLTGLKLADWSKKEIPSIPKELKCLQLELDKNAENVLCVQEEEMGAIAVDYFSSLFETCNPSVDSSVLDVVNLKVTEEMNSFMDKPFSKEEVKGVL